jgi:hypothetical protein
MVRVGDGVVAADATGVDVEDGVEVVGADAGTRPEGAAGVGDAAVVVTVVVGAVADGEVVQDG